MKVEQRSLRVLRIGCALLLVIIASAWIQDTWATNEALLVANSSVPGDSLSKKDVKAIFLGKKALLDGVSITIVTLSEGEAHKDFLKSMLGKTPSQFESHWKKIVFTGKGAMPQSYNTDEELLAVVSTTKGLMGYVSGAAANDARVQDGRVKIIAVQE